MICREGNRQMEITQDINRGLGESSHSKAMASHLGRTSTYDNVSARFLWYSMYNDVADFVKSCNLCQKQGDLTPTIKNELRSVLVQSTVMKQIGVDLCNLVKGYCHLVVCIDYFSSCPKQSLLRTNQLQLLQDSCTN